MEHPKKCPTCNGTGQIPILGAAPTIAEMEICPGCKGVGYIERAETKINNR